MSLVEYVLISEEAWLRAAACEEHDEMCPDDLEMKWGLEFCGYANDDCDSFEFLIVNKTKWFLAKIKHGF